MVLIIEDLDRLKDFVVSVDRDGFIAIFGKNMGDHFWEKFQGLYNFDLIKLWANMDTQYRKMLLDYINTHL